MYVILICKLLDDKELENLKITKLIENLVSYWDSSLQCRTASLSVARYCISSHQDKYRTLHPA